MINRHQLGYHDGLNAFPVQNLNAGSFQEKPECFESGVDYMQGYREGTQEREQRQHQVNSRNHVLA